MIRRELSEHHAYELSPSGNGALLHVSEATGFDGLKHDAAVYLSPASIAMLRDDLTKLAPPSSTELDLSVVSDGARFAVEYLRRAFAALDKVPLTERDAVYRAAVAHVRSDRPLVLREVG